MKKNFKLVLALVLSIMMVLGSVALADTTPVVNTHTITIDNTDQNVNHTYEGYKVFSGNLNATQNTLSDVQWGNGVVPATLLSKIIAANTDSNSPLKGKFDGITTSSTAADVAMKLSGWTSTIDANTAAGDVDAFAALVAESLSTNKITFTRNEKKYTATADSDGYYFIKDVTNNDDLDSQNGSDTISKYLLRITDDITIQAKDTGSKNDKVIVENGTDKNDNNVNIGDRIDYKTTLTPIPNPTKYNRFELEMHDTMEKSLTFMGIDKISMGSEELTFGDDFYYYVNNTKYDKAKGQYQAPNDAVGTTSSHTTETTVRIVFINAKEQILNASGSSHVGETLTVEYHAILNADAELAPESNDNTEHFEFSNDSNYKYNGDEIDNNEPSGKTPNKTVETYTTALQIKKVDESNAPLAGATFTITATDVFNVVRETGDTFVQDNTGTYWKLLDGSYTETDPDTVTDPDTQYASTTIKYAKTHYDDTIVSPDASSSNKVYTVTSGADGIIRLEGIKAGTYTVTEVAAPDGYNALKGQVDAVIDWSTVHGTAWAAPDDRGRGGFVLTSSTGTQDYASKPFTMTSTGEVVTAITIMNNKGATLPSTGGIGTTIFYVAGSIMVLAAAILLITKRRMGNND